MAVTPPPAYTGLLSEATNIYMTAFGTYTKQLMSWGKEFFTVLLTINITWLALWYAFDKDSMMAGMSDFLKKFTIIFIFYAVMVNPEYLGSLISTTSSMGAKVTGHPTDPSYIISEGLHLGSQVLAQVKNSGFWSKIPGFLTALVVYIVIIFCFMSVALQVAVAQLVSTALAMIACLTLSFVALGASAKIAHKTLDALVGNCFKLLGYYIVIGTSTKVFTIIGQRLEGAKGFEDMTPYGWMCASALLMWLLSKNLAGVFERIGSGIVGDTQGADAAALALSAVRTASMVASGVGTVAKVAQGAYKVGKTVAQGGAKLMSKATSGSSTKPPGGSGKAKRAANDPTMKGPNNTGGGQGQVKGPGGAAANDAIGKNNSQNKAANDSHAGKGGGSSKSSSGGGRARTYPGMSKDKQEQA